MITLRQFAEYLESDVRLNDSINRLSKDLLSDNIAPLYAFSLASDNKDLSLIVDSIKLKFANVDTNSIESIKNTKYDWLRRAILNEPDRVLDGRSTLLIGSLLERRMPTIDDYIVSIDDTELAEAKGLQLDDEGLVLIDSSIELKKHAIILKTQNTMLYPHQFLRRFYTANFVDNISIAKKMSEKGLKVEIRVDPFRQSTPDKYIGYEERDFWFGKPFSRSVFDDTTTAPVRTIHYTPDTDLRKLLSQPPMYSVFRTNIMDEVTSQRQFFVEEYMPYKNLINENFGNPSGVTDRYVIQKFAHFVYDQQSKSFSHIDCAVRIFTKDEYSRLYDLLKTGKDFGSKVGDRKKLVKVSGVLDFEDIQAILYEFFRGNPHIEEYFSSRKKTQ